MNTRPILLSGILLVMTIPAFAQATSGMQGMQMGEGVHGMKMHETAQGTGVIKAIDATRGTVTIQHQAIASIHWPAMTMTFKVDPPGLLQSVKIGEKVNFTLHPDGANSTVTALVPVR